MGDHKTDKLNIVNKDAEFMLNSWAGLVDLIITDPPYGIDYKSNRQAIDRKQSNARLGDFVVRPNYFKKIANDATLPLVWLKSAFHALKLNSALYVFCHWSRWGELSSAAEREGFTLKNMIVLNKSNHGMGDLKGSYAPKHELLLYAVKGRRILNFPNGRDNDVWDVPVRFSGAHRLHPTEKPQSWVERAILNSSNVGDLVCDPFAGSGSFLKAAIRLDRRAIGSDIDPQYCGGAA